MFLINNASQTLINASVQKRNFWHWLNIIFNKVDEDRRIIVGPDRACAEWLLRNGAKVRWRGSGELLGDYNLLPPEGAKLYIEEVDASDSSIMHYGFPHFAGCKYIDKLILHKCGYLEDGALEAMQPLKETLKYLQVSSCGNITDKGLNALQILTNLETLIMFNLPYVKDKRAVVANLTNKLTNCKISFE